MSYSNSQETTRKYFKGKLILLAVRLVFAHDDTLIQGPTVAPQNVENLQYPIDHSIFFFCYSLEAQTTNCLEKLQHSFKNNQQRTTSPTFQCLVFFFLDIYHTKIWPGRYSINEKNRVQFFYINHDGTKIAKIVFLLSQRSSNIFWSVPISLGLTNSINIIHDKLWR